MHLFIIHVNNIIIFSYIYDFFKLIPPNNFSYLVFLNYHPCSTSLSANRMNTTGFATNKPPRLSSKTENHTGHGNYEKTYLDLIDQLCEGMTKMASPIQVAQCRCDTCWLGGSHETRAPNMETTHSSWNKGWAIILGAIKQPSIQACLTNAKLKQPRIVDDKNSHDFELHWFADPCLDDLTQSKQRNKPQWTNNCDQQKSEAS